MFLCPNCKPEFCWHMSESYGPCEGCGEHGSTVDCHCPAPPRTPVIRNALVAPPKRAKKPTKPKRRTVAQRLGVVEDALVEILDILRKHDR